MKKVFKLNSAWTEVLEISDRVEQDILQAFDWCNSVLAVMVWVYLEQIKLGQFRVLYHG